MVQVSTVAKEKGVMTHTHGRDKCKPNHLDLDVRHEKMAHIVNGGKRTMP